MPIRNLSDTIEIIILAIVLVGAPLAKSLIDYFNRRHQRKIEEHQGQEQARRTLRVGGDRPTPTRPVARPLPPELSTASAPTRRPHHPAATPVQRVGKDETVRGDETSPGESTLPPELAGLPEALFEILGVPKPRPRPAPPPATERRAPKVVRRELKAPSPPVQSAKSKRVVRRRARGATPPAAGGTLPRSTAPVPPSQVERDHRVVFSPAMVTAPDAVAIIDPIASLRRASAAAWRKAVILQELLAPPLAFREDSDLPWNRD